MQAQYSPRSMYPAGWRFPPPPVLDPMMAEIRNRKTGEVLKVIRMDPEWEVVLRLDLPRER